MDHQENADYRDPHGTTPGGSTQGRLTRSQEDRILGGVCGGIGRYLDLDPVLFRLAFVLLLIAGGSGILIYIIAWIIIPEAEKGSEPAVTGDRGNVGLIVGGGLILIGAVLLMQRLFSWFDSQLMFAMFLIALGAFVVMRGVNSGKR